MSYDFWSYAQEHPDDVAIVSGGGGEVSFGDLLVHQDAAAHGLLGLGLETGDVVALYLANVPEFLELALACLQTGLYVLPINSHLSASEAAYILKDAGAKVLVSSEGYAEVVRAAAAEAGLPPEHCFSIDGSSAFRPYQDLKAGQPAGRPTPRVAGEIMLYTSGTTGRPKGVRRPLSGEAPEAAATKLAGFVMHFCDVGPGAPHAQLVTGPLYHATPGGLAVAALHLGHTLVLMDKWDPARTLQLIEERRVSYMHVVPTMFHRMLMLPEQVRQAHDLTSLRGVLHGAAPCPPDVKRRIIDWFGPIVNEYYGSSEGGGALARSAEWLERPGTVGRPWPGSTITVVGDDGRQCAPGEPGTVYLKMAGWDFAYHNAPDKTEASMRDGFFTVGDIGYLDEDGYLFLSGRSAELIISGGTNIYPAEIENCLLEHPAVADAAVFGLPNAEWGEEVKAVIEVRPGTTADDALAEELKAHCRARLAGFKVPRSVSFRDALPRTDSGKLSKRLLVEEFAAPAS